MERDEERIGRLTEALSEANLDALCCRLPHHVLMCTGYWPVLGNSTALLTRAGEIAVIVPNDEQELAHDGWVDNEHILSFEAMTPNDMGNANEATLPILAEIARRFGLARGAIGYEASFDLTPIPYIAHRADTPSTAALCQSVLPDADFWDASALLRTQRGELTPREVAAVRRACRIAGEGFAVVPTLLRPGVAEVEIAVAVRGRIEVSALQDQQVRRAGGHAYCVSGVRGAYASRGYALSTNRAIESGDIVLVHVNAYVDGFWTNLTRTYLMGEPSGRQMAMYEAILESRGRALAAVAEGALASEVDAIARDHLRESGFAASFIHPLGHGVGYGAVHSGDIPRLHPCSDDRLARGMTLSIGPAIYDEGVGGVRHRDVVSLGEDGVHVLSPFHGSLSDLIVGVRDA